MIFRSLNFDPGDTPGPAKCDFFGHGNDQESSSEAITWRWRFLGVTSNKKMRDLGVYLCVTEGASVLNYWFDIHGIVFDPRYPKPIAVWSSAVAMGIAPGGPRSPDRSTD